MSNKAQDNTEDNTRDIPQKNPEQTLDLIIVNSGMLMTTYSESILWCLSEYNLGVNFNVEIVRDELLKDGHTYEAFPKDAVIYTHLAAGARFITVAGVKSLSEDTSSTYYRPDLRFIVSIDQTVIQQIEPIVYGNSKGSQELYEYIKRISKNKLDPANIVSCTFERDWLNFFSNEEEDNNEEEDSWINNFRGYVKKLLKIRAGLREGQTQNSTR